MRGPPPPFQATNGTVLETKDSLRADMRRRRSAVAPDERTRASAEACTRLLDLPEVRTAARVGLYAALPGELDVAPALRALLRRGVAVLLPRVVDRDLELVPFDEAIPMKPGFRGVLEPTGTASGDRLDVIVVPGLAFDREGRRLGQGGGHYDRLLARLGARGVRVGVGFDFQIVDEVPGEAHDERVHALVTERRMLRTPAAEHLPD